MIKLLIVAILAVVLYKLVVGQPLLGRGQDPRDKQHDREDEAYSDYEEID